jgi:DNA-binding Lrp family transcriptional regulator
MRGVGMDGNSTNGTIALKAKKSKKILQTPADNSLLLSSSGRPQRKSRETRKTGRAEPAKKRTMKKQMNAKDQDQVEVKSQNQVEVITTSTGAVQLTVMPTVDLDSLSIEQLQALLKRAQEQQNEGAQKRLAALKEKFEEMAREFGITPSALAREVQAIFRDPNSRRVGRTVSAKTIENRKKVAEYLETHAHAKTNDIAIALGISYPNVVAIRKFLRSQTLSASRE